MELRKCNLPLKHLYATRTPEVLKREEREAKERKKLEEKRTKDLNCALETAIGLAQANGGLDFLTRLVGEYKKRFVFHGNVAVIEL